MNYVYKSEELTCKPLDGLKDILLFLDNPPPWRTLCKELTVHSNSKIKNTDINKRSEVNVEEPENFCHYNPDADDPIRSDGDKLPKTLLCHDMANGYHDDSYIDGTTNYDSYSFYNWAGIDIFCYFSHHFITIPPLSWINVGHAHGVKVIGTVITEWASGCAIWNQVLSTETEYQNFASALVAIAKTLKLDGWLLNVENKITKPDVLLSFVQYLNRLLHEEIPHAVLIWYDSVTVAGTLNWQNGLNAKNRAFFDACDGLFINYSWSEFDLLTSSVEADTRAHDLYVGIDVWGRNFIGGGKFNTQEAVKMVHETGCSLAIFAPAWTHEALSTTKGDEDAVAVGDHLSKYKVFQLRDRALWGSLWPFLNTRLPSALPFATSFCRGHGKKRRLCGEVISPGPWYNLRHQQYQPNSAHGPHGYILSTKTIGTGISHQGVAKDSKSIIRYRDSFQAIRSTLLSTQVIREAEETPPVSLQGDAEGKAGANPPADIQSSSDEEENRNAGRGRIVATPQGPRSIKDRIQEAFRHVFHKRPVDEAPEGSRGPSSEPAGSSAKSNTFLASGKSMVKMSLNLHLRRGRTRHRVALGCVPHEHECLELHLEDSFTGGACLRVHASDRICREHRFTRLLHCDFPCAHALLACVVTKPTAAHERQYLNLRLDMVNRAGRAACLVLVGRRLPPAAAALPADLEGVRTVAPLDATERRFQDLQRYLLLHVPGFYVPVENAFGWFVRYYEVQLPGSRVASVTIRAGLEHGSHLLGHFGLCALPPGLTPEH